MKLSVELLTLAGYLAGEFENEQQAIADPSWYVRLRLWQRPLPTPLFAEPGITFFAEQANTLKLDRPYRQRILHLYQSDPLPDAIAIQYYMPQNPEALSGAGRDPKRLEGLGAEDLEFLPECRLQVTRDLTATQGDRFLATLPPNARCCFPYQQQIRQVHLGFEIALDRENPQEAIEFLSYDKGIDPVTGQALWGAILGPYRFIKQQDYQIPAESLRNPS